ncbi:hypothetical protein [Marinifilum sp.]|uniref:hypothetical protein n=1 Tax=Marinifilum sp. TaxID=2033137 RepID=UPI003BAD74A1
MKKNLPFLAMLFFCLGCSPPKQVNKTPSNYPTIKLHEKKVESSQQIAPGTCYLSLKDCEIISENVIKGKVSQLHGYGAGFTEVFQLNEEITIKISNNDLPRIYKLRNLSCVISKVEKMNDYSFLKLIEIK